MVTRPTRREVDPISGRKFELGATTEAVRAVFMMGEPGQLLDGSVASDAARTDEVHTVSEYPAGMAGNYLILTTLNSVLVDLVGGLPLVRL
jgi:hypothetical protein